MSHLCYLLFNIQFIHLSIGPTVFCGKFCQIPRPSSQNSAAKCGKTVKILWLTVAFLLCIN